MPKRGSGESEAGPLGEGPPWSWRSKGTLLGICRVPGIKLVSHHLPGLEVCQSQIQRCLMTGLELEGLEAACRCLYGLLDSTSETC